MRRLAFALMIIAGLAFAGSLGALLALRSDRAAPTDPLRADPDLADLTVPPFTATASDGRTVSRADFQGRLTVVSFMFTHCTLICPMLTQHMADLQSRLRDVPKDRARLLSLSVDPAHDTPDVLAEYARKHLADPARWTFARTDEEAVRRIVGEGLKFAVGPDPRSKIGLPDGSTMDNILHPPWFVLIGPDGGVIGLYNPSVPGQLETLADRVRAGAGRLPTAPPAGDGR